MNSKEKADLIVQFADETKAEQIETLDVHKKTTIADYFIVCTGNSDVHMNAIASRVEEKMRAHKIKPLRAEKGGGGWILLDYGDVVVHIMRDESRQFYDIESLWNSIQPNPDILD